MLSISSRVLWKYRPSRSSADAYTRKLLLAASSAVICVLFDQGKLHAALDRFVDPFRFDDGYPLLLLCFDQNIYIEQSGPYLRSERLTFIIRRDNICRKVRKLRLSICPAMRMNQCFELRFIVLRIPLYNICYQTPAPRVTYRR